MTEHSAPGAARQQPVEVTWQAVSHWPATQAYAVFPDHQAVFRTPPPDTPSSIPIPRRCNHMQCPPQYSLPLLQSHRCNSSLLRPCSARPSTASVRQLLQFPTPGSLFAYLCTGNRSFAMTNVMLDDIYFTTFSTSLSRGHYFHYRLTVTVTGPSARSKHTAKLGLHRRRSNR